jgi:hypothetical protein
MMESCETKGRRNFGEAHAKEIVDENFPSCRPVACVRKTVVAVKVCEAPLELPQFAGEYFALGPMPAYGFYARNARGITLQNMRFQVSTPDLRPAMILDHMEDVAISGLSVQGNTEADSVLRFIDSSQILLTGSRVLTPSSTFLQIEGANNDGIIVEGGDLSKAASAVTFNNGATEKAVKMRHVL